MAITVIPRGDVPLGQEHEFFKFVCPPTFGGGPVDAQPATIKFARKLDVMADLPLPAGVKTYNGGNSLRLWLIADPNDSSSNGATFPAKTIRTKKGDVVWVDTGFSFNTHTIHWHGIEPTPMNDGVGHTSFEVSGNFTYQFATNTAGTYIYHCHKNTVLHFIMGLYGLFVVDPPQGPKFAAANAPGAFGFDPVNFSVPIDVEAAWVPGEFDSIWNDLGHNAFMQKCDQNDPAGAGTFTQNGFLNRFRPDIVHITGVVSVPGNPITDPRVSVAAKTNQNILVRLVHAGYTVQEYTLGLDATVIGEDGHPLGVPPFDKYSFPFVIPANTPFRLTSARRYDLLLNSPNAGVFPFQVKFMDWINGTVYQTAQTTVTVV